MTGDGAILGRDSLARIGRAVRLVENHLPGRPQRGRGPGLSRTEVFLVRVTGAPDLRGTYPGVVSWPDPESLQWTDYGPCRLYPVNGQTLYTGVIYEALPAGDTTPQQSGSGGGSLTSGSGVLIGGRLYLTTGCCPAVAGVGQGHGSGTGEGSCFCPWQTLCARIINCSCPFVDGATYRVLGGGGFGVCQYWTGPTLYTGNVGTLGALDGLCCGGLVDAILFSLCGDPVSNTLTDARIWMPYSDITGQNATGATTYAPPYARFTGLHVPAAYINAIGIAVNCEMTFDLEVGALGLAADCTGTGGGDGTIISGCCPGNGMGGGGLPPDLHVTVIDLGGASACAGTYPISWDGSSQWSYSGALPGTAFAFHCGTGGIICTQMVLRFQLGGSVLHIPVPPSSCDCNVPHFEFDNGGPGYSLVGGTCDGGQVALVVGA